jgi:ubiquinone/menaquinone biosynthesis C-methylase UbiE
MLAHARAGARSQDSVLAADVRALPFADDSFDLVLCCRFLHHQRTDEELLEVLRELVRVTRHLLVASYWDYASLPALRTRAGLKPSETRRAVRRSRMEDLVRQAGAEIASHRSAVRWISQQTFFLARKRSGAEAGASR